ncbi:acetyl-CoA carboxylase biotin carboxylase subunit [Latilactobacillus curvatus]|uniref:acetyl-CoA carboxylase biotin carboxylase subunit n=1 Tax=Latilactobacillus curvatus TaxID=28038 RepID=UPI0007EBFACE|nr:acetyl-CoA carboxylase biotin carboxylase subunit [Latilactobacillus curvatus]ANJ69478.1 acetyl-CoA carboxylase biotin carboxylase subunit [Latilactobacillus curvatus]QEA49835.1 acetyl-CoA carboxylase biotin carboxylase subunit [Latilactobacillus curvatus]WBY49664.1 acetyl-CoA carboxylase biotin carboxylase subunit [Latilactobacillus curvatus]WIE01720.1 acetyl-CoA carboxylase biotin carboxylase subunit [Latilactobacillus curvatus]BBE26087.1 acetyl-CoA carboxylase, biotin carboxylase subunit
MFKKVLVANRGEIALHIVRTLKEMAIPSVSVYSKADASSLHVQLADEAVCIGGNRPQESYLNMQNILSAAIGTGCDAIHPGYGFLSENSQFAEMCEACGITFIGPSSNVIAQMGDKSQAKISMQAAAVPLIPGSAGPLADFEQAEEIAAQVGYPVMLKAVAGGGGKGIRFVESAEQLADSYAQAQLEAAGAFGNDQLYLEKIMLNVKHIEVQIFRDQFGNAVYFPERDCSMQRFKQKVIEETPCQLITEAQRQQLGAIALKAVEQINYVNTGTVEFLMDEAHQFYFLEMNTRIQVEHPVTEMVTGIDLVQEQINVAAGLPLSFTQADVQSRGYALECRLNAEDPANHFAPSAGTINYLYLPAGNLGVRIDTHLYSGYAISPFYDAMIAKLITWGATREIAIAKMRRLLSELIVSGIQTNAQFQQTLLIDPVFLDGTVTTDYLTNKETE